MSDKRAGDFAGTDGTFPTGRQATPPYTVPFTVSILISESFFNNFYSPASTIIIPFLRPFIPYGYAIIILMELLTALLVKWSSAPYSYSLINAGYFCFPTGIALPDMDSLRRVYNLQASERSLASAGSLDSGQGSPPAPNREDTPLLPRGMTINLSFSSPFSTPPSKTATLFSIELIEIKNIPGYLVPLIALLLYFISKSFFKGKANANSRD